MNISKSGNYTNLCTGSFSDFIDYVNSARYTTLLISNQLFERSTTGYAAPEAAYLLLLHIWSLSIEWQWYLLLPAGIIFMHCYLSDKSIKIATTLLIVITTILSIVLSAKYPDKSYYFFTSRIFEFLIGSSLVILRCEKYKPRKTMGCLFGITSFFTLNVLCHKSKHCTGLSRLSCSDGLFSDCITDMGGNIKQ